MRSTILLGFIMMALVASTSAQAQDATAAAGTSTNGIKLIDPTRGVEFNAPNPTWGVNAGKHSISLNHNQHYDAHVTLKKSWYTVATAQEAYDKRKKSLKSYIPGAIFLKENQEVTIGTLKGMSMTYKNPSDLKIKREIMFIHKGKAYELVFQAKEQNFQTVKADFGYILQNMKLY